MKIIRLTAAAALLALAACSASPTAPAAASADRTAAQPDLSNGQGMIGGGTRSEP